MDFETLLFDRLEIIKTVNQKYDLEHYAHMKKFFELLNKYIKYLWD